jgi:hypothetical protein
VEVPPFRIIQESLNNVHRYSGSRTTFVRLKLTPGNRSARSDNFGVRELLTRPVSYALRM